MKCHIMRSNNKYIVPYFVNKYLEVGTLIHAACQKLIPTHVAKVMHWSWFGVTPNKFHSLFLVLWFLFLLKIIDIWMLHCLSLLLFLLQNCIRLSLILFIIMLWWLLYYQQFSFFSNHLYIWSLAEMSIVLVRAKNTSLCIFVKHALRSPNYQIFFLNEYRCQNCQTLWAGLVSP